MIGKTPSVKILKGPYHWNMSYDGRKNDDILSRHCRDSGPKKKLIPWLKNAYDEIDRLNEVLRTKDGLDFFIFLLYNIINKPSVFMNRKRTKIGR